MAAADTKTQFNINRASAWVLLVVLVTFILQTLDFLFIPLCFAILLCYALGIPLEFMKRYHLPGFVRIILVVGLVLLLIFMLGKLVMLNVNNFQSQMPEYEKKFWEYANIIISRFDISPEQANEAFQTFLGRIQLSQFTFGSLIKSFSGSFFAFLGNVLWVVLFMAFILAERESFTRRLVNQLGKKNAGPVMESLQKINDSVQQYLGLKTLVSFLTGALVTIVLTIAGVDFALLWGVLTFVLNFIPTIGSIVATLPPIAITLFQSGSIGKTLIIAVLLLSIQFAVGNILEPKLMGRGLNLSPLVVLFSLIFWGWLWGIPGMLLSVPLTAAIRIAMEQIDATKTVAVLISSK
ncbi:MAG: AI-2E family transporter [Deltaproteobacteria bacterium]|jgi:predicted PurR-regulated permease PerM|nr:AI-2E family transporter [Deltaproteobacteria bacterium]